MPDIDYELTGAWTVKRRKLPVLSVTEDDLFRSAAVVGMPLLAADPQMERPLLEMCWRVMMVQTNLVPSTSGTAWTRSAAYDRLDPSEKTAVSYFLGMVQSHLLAQLLGYSHLVHVDRLLQLAGKPLKDSRPDFLAVSMGSPGQRAYGATWESKGRTNGFDAVALTKAKDQARKIPTITGLKPRETIASESFFDPKTGSWRAKLADPEWEGHVLPIDMEDYLLAFYEPLVHAADEAGAEESANETLTFQLPRLRVTVALPSELVRAVRVANEMGKTERAAERPLSGAYQMLVEQSRPGLGTDMVEVVVEREQ